MENKTLDQEIKEELKKFSKKPYYFLAIGILIMFSTPIIFTQSISWLPKFNASTGAIGDTIGGITAPFINLIGAMLVFISFREQQKANKIQVITLNREMKQNQKAATLNQHTTSYNIILELIKDFKMQYEGDKKGYSRDGKNSLDFFNLMFRQASNFYPINEYKILSKDFKYLERIVKSIDTYPLTLEQRRILVFRLKNYIDAVYVNSITSSIDSLKATNSFFKNSESPEDWVADEVDFILEIKNKSIYIEIIIAVNIYLSEIIDKYLNDEETTN